MKKKKRKKRGGTQAIKKFSAAVPQNRVEVYWNQYNAISMNIKYKTRQ